MRVLLVEDDDQDVRLLRARIADDDVTGQVRLTHVRCLAEAKGALADGEFDAALLDLGLPDSRGLETYRSLAELSQDLPIVVLSGDTNHTLAIAAVREGAQDYLVKGRVTGDMLVRVLCYATERGGVLARERDALQRERVAAERLRQLDEMKDTFLQAVSHELRTPLASVYGYALTLRDNRRRLSDELTQRLLDRLAANADRLNRLLDDLLDVNRLAARALEVRGEEADLATLAATAAGHVELAAHHLELDLQPTPVFVEPGKVERIAENLVRNAVKHTPPGTTIWVRTTPVEEGALLTVADDGPGIDDDLKSDVFTAFRQGNRSQHQPSPGTGIGLNLVAKFAELHGGRAWVDDRPGGGARFHVLFPGDADRQRAIRG